MLNSQGRLLKIFLELIDGKVLTKQHLIEEFNKESVTIQRDMALINEVLEERAESHYFHSEDSKKVLLDEYVEAHLIQRPKKGQYQLENFSSSLNSDLTEEELLVTLKILLASRALEKGEMIELCGKIAKFSKQPDQLNRFIANEKLDYEGIPKVGTLAKIQFICDCIIQHKEIEFSYTKYGKTEILRRVPNAIYFADMYIYMLTAKENAQDDADLKHLSKFRIHNMKNEKVVSVRNKTNYTERFEGGVLRKQTSLPFLGNPVTLTIDFFWDPVYVLDRFPDSKIISEKDGVYRIVMEVNDGYGMKMWLLSQGDMVKVISPNHMKDYIINDMKDALNYYGYDLVKRKDNE